MIDLHYWPTPNGKKVTILLEELGMPYRIVPVNIGRGDQFKDEFLEMNPNHRMPVMVDHAPTGFDQLRTIAVARLYLDNFGHITAYWIGMGLKMAQVALSYGADDIHGTIVEERIFHMAGAKSPQLQTEKELVKAIREAGRTPVQRDTFYQPIKVWDEPEAAGVAKTEAGGDASGERARETNEAVHSG